jgi:hypothetical protein
MKRHWGSRRLFVNNSESGGLDGLGMDSYGSGDELARFNGAATFGDLSQSPRTQWCIATETSSCSLDQTFIGYPDRDAMYHDFGQLIGLGVKGIFSFGIMLHVTDGDGGWAPCDMSRDPRQLEWLGSFGRMLRGRNQLLNYRPRYYYWYPAQELDSLTSDGYDGLTGAPRTGIRRSPGGTWIVPTFTPDVDTPLLITNLKEQAAIARYGNALEQTLKRPGSQIRHAVLDLNGTLATSYDLIRPTQDVLRQIGGITRLDTPPGIEGYSFIESDGTPLVLLWSITGAPTIQIQATDSKRFTLVIPGSAPRNIVAGTVTLKLPDLQFRTFKFGPLDSTVSDGATPVEVRWKSVGWGPTNSPSELTQNNRCKDSSRKVCPTDDPSVHA